ncbi:MAG: deoxyhypusine synthase family protein [Phycisphaerales bacterium]|nr:deoxyhypusine synthase family protein [Phycisphaerales bacterium]
MSIRSFMEEHYRHFNAAATLDAAKGYSQHLESGGKMLISLAGAMSTAELGRSLAQMIRQGKVHAISCTGANLEEDVFNLVAHDHYERIPNYRDLTPEDEQALLDRGLNRVTDTCIPEEEAFRVLEQRLLDLWVTDESNGLRRFPHEYFYELLLSGQLEQHYQADPKNSWLLAAAQHNLPVVVPGWEDSTCGNIFAAHVLTGEISSPTIVKSGIEYMTSFIDWYKNASSDSSVGFFQIGGGIAGDFPICAVPLIRQDLREDVPLWGYFCQISDSTTSYGSYSGAVPNEKITWEKLGVETPKYIIESDATIVAPLIFGYVLNY